MGYLYLFSEDEVRKPITTTSKRPVEPPLIWSTDGYPIPNFNFDKIHHDKIKPV